ncbi:unnamed protein product, partial [Ectocarpus sp. 8 AP-2014]
KEDAVTGPGRGAPARGITTASSRNRKKRCSRATFTTTGGRRTSRKPARVKAGRASPRSTGRPRRPLLNIQAAERSERTPQRQQRLPPARVRRRVAPPQVLSRRLPATRGAVAPVLLRLVLVGDERQGSRELQLPLLLLLWQNPTAPHQSNGQGLSDSPSR